MLLLVGSLSYYFMPYNSCCLRETQDRTQKRCRSKRVQGWAPNYSALPEILMSQRLMVGGASAA